MEKYIEREIWDPCEYCNGKTSLYQHTHTTKLFMNTFGEEAILVTECMACPPYADCCMNGISVNSAFKINFCPNCGRPLTEEAWQELEKRVRGEKVKCKFEHDEDCCNSGSPQYMCKCKSDICHSAVYMTNADQIRAMSDEELLDFMIKTIGNAVLCKTIGAEPKFCTLEWLKQPADKTIL